MAMKSIKALKGIKGKGVKTPKMKTSKVTIVKSLGKKVGSKKVKF